MAGPERGCASNAVFYHVPDATDTSRPRLMGRQAAGEGFLRGYVAHSGVPEFHCLAPQPAHAADFERRVAAWDTVGRRCVAHGFADLARVGELGTLFAPEPTLLSSQAWRRRRVGERNHGITAVTHTIASEAVMRGLGNLLTAPVQPWDALVCTSAAVRRAVLGLLDGFADYLEARTGGRPDTVLELPVIPLGVDCDALAATPAAADARARIRTELGIAGDDVAFLFVGRLSFHAKAHPLPMYLGLQAAARTTGRTLHLIQAGWFAHASIERQFELGAKSFCPDVRVHFVDGRKPAFRRNVWFAADVFTSLSDNVQETFGLTPIEAMAAGLPVVATDWNGYRDTLRPGVDGLLVPTWMPASGAGDALALPRGEGLAPAAVEAAYDLYLGQVSQATAVDVASCAEAYAALAANAELRRRMGEAGRRRARERFDWRVVVAAYQSLWEELAERRRSAPVVAAADAAHGADPLHPDPFDLFAGYPSLGADAQIAATDEPPPLDAIESMFMNHFAEAWLLPRDARRALLAQLARDGPRPVGEILAEADAEQRAAVARSLGWLAKMGKARILPPQRSEPEP